MSPPAMTNLTAIPELNLNNENKVSLKRINSLKHEGYKAYTNEQKYKEAKRAFIETIESLESHNKPVDRFLLFNTAMCYLNIGNLDSTAQYLMKAVKVDPFFALAMYFLGYVKIQGGFEYMCGS